MKTNTKLMETQELEKSPTNVENEESSSNSNLTKFEKIDKTPFTIYGSEEEGYIILMGKYRLTEKLSHEEAHKQVHEITWEKITQVVMTMVETLLYDKEFINHHKK